MKVWISLCLMWLMVRVVSARPLGPESGNIIWGIGSNSLSRLEEATDIQFSNVQKALKEIKFKRPERYGDEQARVIKMMASHDSLEHFMIRPLLAQGSILGLSVPRPSYSMSPLELRLYEVLAVRYLYPEVRFIHAISQSMATKMANDGFLISRDERLIAQEKCFTAKDFGESCLFENALKPVISAIVEQVNREHDGDLESEAIYKQFLALIEKGGATSIVYWDAYALEAAESYLNSKTLGDILLTCVSYPRSFFAWQLVGPGRCDRAFKDEMKELGIHSPLIADAIVKRVVMNRFSPLQKALVSLSSEVLHKGVFCFSDDCVVRKVRERLEEWSFSNQLSTKEKDDLAKAIATYWSE